MTPDDEIDIEERACILEFDGGVPRLEAVRLAREAWHEQQVARQVARIRRVWAETHGGANKVQRRVYRA